MELDNFKNIWKSQLERDINSNENVSEKIKGIIMKTTDILSELTYSNRYWWKSIKTTMILLLGITAINLVMFLLFPENFQHIKNPFPYYAIIASFAFISLGLYYFQLKIFDINISVDLRSAIENAIRQFNKFYLLYNMSYIILFPILFYFITKVTLQLFDINMTLSSGLFFSVALTVICLLINHFYYKKKYFRRIIQLKINLKELNQAEK
jgi:hypothetical protein